MSATTLILALALGTFALRIAPLVALERVQLPAWARRWLSLVPGAVLAASLSQTLLLSPDALASGWRNPYLLAAVPALLLAWRTRNILLTMLGGMAAFALLQHWL